jgi:hypothetical protein
LERNIPLIGDILIDDTLNNDDVFTISQSIKTGINARATLIDLFLVLARPFFLKKKKSYYYRYVGVSAAVHKL